MNSQKQAVTVLIRDRAHAGRKPLIVDAERPLTDAELAQVALHLGKHVEIIQVVKTRENSAAAEKTRTSDDAGVRANRKRCLWLRSRKMTVISIAAAILATSVSGYNSQALNRGADTAGTFRPEIRRAILVEPEVRRAIPVEPEIRKAIQLIQEKPRKRTL